MALRFPVKAVPRQILAIRANPEAANQPEALPWVLYDTQAWTTAVTFNTTHFLTQPTDPTMGNMEGPGQLPDPQFFEIWYWGVDFLLASINAAAPGATVSHWADIIQFLWTQRGTFEFNISNKKTGQFPLSFFHGSGGPQGFGYGNSATTARFEYGNNGPADGGYCVAGAIVIPPKLGFNVTLRTFAAPTLVSGSPLNVRTWMAGVLHRRVL